MLYQYDDQTGEERDHVDDHEYLVHGPLLLDDPLIMGAVVSVRIRGSHAAAAIPGRRIAASGHVSAGAVSAGPADIEAVECEGCGVARAGSALYSCQHCQVRLCRGCFGLADPGGGCYSCAYELLQQAAAVGLPPEHAGRPIEDIPVLGLLV